MTVKKIGSELYDDFLKLGEYAFQYQLSEKDIEDRKFQMDKQILFGSYNNDHLAAKLHVLPMELFLGSKKFKFGGIAGVATWPEYRRQGHVDKLISQALVEMKSKGMTISMLAPFSVGFYRKFGWELTHYVHKYRFKPLDIGKGRGEGYCRRVYFKHDKEVLQQMYEQMATKYSLMMKREFWWWERRVLSDDDTILVYFDKENKPKGYMITKMKDKVLDVMEFVFLSSDACKGMLEWIRNHDSMTEQVNVVLQPNDQIVYYFDNPKISMQKESYFMTRIVDFESFLYEYPFFNSSKEIVIEINLKDDKAEWNNGKWTLVIKDNHLVSLSKDDSLAASIKITTDIQSLSAWLFNSEPFERLLFFERISVEGDVNTLKTIICPLKPALMDFF